MAYDTVVKGVWNFNGTMGEDVSGNDFSSTHPATYGPFSRYNYLTGTIDASQALVFGDNQTYTTETSLPAFNFVQSGLYYSLWVGFWYYSPGVVGFTRHPITRRLSTKRAPVIAKALTTESSGVEAFLTGEFVLSEISISATENAMELALCTVAGNPSHIITSAGYEPGWHYVSFGILETIVAAGYGCVRVEIDADQPAQVLVPHITTTTNAITLNNIGYGYTACKVHQTGAMIKDLVILSDLADTTTKYRYLTHSLAAECMRFGVEAITEDGFINKYSTCTGIVFSQPSSVTTNQIYVSGSSILAARSNGQLLKGVKPIWDIEYNYPTDESLNDITILDTTKATWSPQGLSLNGTRVKV